MRPRLIALVVGLASALAPGMAAAEELRLSWRAPRGCPTETEVRDAALRSAKIGAQRDPLDAQVSVEHGERCCEQRCHEQDQFAVASPGRCCERD